MSASGPSGPLVYVIRDLGECLSRYNYWITMTSSGWMGFCIAEYWIEEWQYVLMCNKYFC